MMDLQELQPLYELNRYLQTIKNQKKDTKQEEKFTVKKDRMPSMECKSIGAPEEVIQDPCVLD